jgi:hypothetical protein
MSYLAPESHDANGFRETGGVPMPRRLPQLGADTLMKRRANRKRLHPHLYFWQRRAASSYITGEIVPIIGSYSGG